MSSRSFSTTIFLALIFILSVRGSPLSSSGKNKVCRPHGSSQAGLGWNPTPTNNDNEPSPTAWDGWAVPPTVLCYTSWTTLSNPFPATATAWYSTPCSVTSTITSTFVTTPATPISTSTVSVTTTITASATTNTATATETDTTTSTITSTVTETDTATTTTTSSTSTTTTVAVATFSPIDVTDPGVTPPTKKKRDVTIPEKRSQKNFNDTIAVGGISIGDMFPGEVLCNHYTTSQCSTVTVTSTTTSTASTPDPTTITTTTTLSTTTTPGVSTTTTTTITATATTTTTTTTDTTTTTTTTQTSVTAVATYYADCGTANQAAYYDGYGIQGSSGGTDAAIFAQGSTAYECCVSALLNPLGAGYAFSLNGAGCYIFTVSTCTAGQSSGSPLNAVYEVGTAPAYILGNAYCGSFTKDST